MCCAPLMHGLDARAAQAIHREGRHFMRHAGLEPDVTRAVMRIDAALLDVAEHHVVDPLGLRAGPFERRLRRDGAEIDRGEILQRARRVAVIGVRAPPRMKTCLAHEVFMCLILRFLTS